MIFKILIILLALAMAASAYVWQQFGKNPTSEELKKYEQLSYFKNSEFQSPQKLVYDFNNVRNGSVGFARFLSQSEFAPKHELPKLELNSSSFAQKPDDFAIYWLGHSAAIMELDGKRLVFDPVFDNAAPIPLAVPRYGKSPLQRQDIPDVDYIVITHNHYDHLEKKTVQQIKTGHFIVPLGVGKALQGWGVEKERITELGWGEKLEENNFKIVAEEGVHYSNRSPFNRNKTLWNSYAIISPSKKIFWGGDTGYSEHFKKIGKKYGGFDLAVLEIDGWNTGWPNTHLFPNEVIKATLELKASRLLPIHWAVFDLALHPWDESINMIFDEAEGVDVKILTPLMGEKIGLDTNTQHWWKR